jgi:hypothetical protein
MMKSKNFLFIILFLFIAGSIVYYTFEEVQLMLQNKDSYQSVYVHSESDDSVPSSIEDDIKNAVIQEAVRMYRSESEKQNFSDAELINIYKKNQ